VSSHKIAPVGEAAVFDRKLVPERARDAFPRRASDLTNTPSPFLRRCYIGDIPGLRRFTTVIAALSDAIDLRTERAGGPKREIMNSQKNSICELAHTLRIGHSIYFCCGQ
jgi:hypothetical protein